jgi:hypothetical protein
MVQRKAVLINESNKLLLGAVTFLLHKMYVEADATE